jgi:hypothetical protein
MPFRRLFLSLENDSHKIRLTEGSHLSNSEAGQNEKRIGKSFQIL